MALVGHGVRDHFVNSEGLRVVWFPYKRILIARPSGSFGWRSCASFLLGYALLVALLSKPGAAQSQVQNPGETGLSTSEVVTRLVQRNAERANALQRYQGRRFYRLDYTGFPEKLHAEMTVDASFTAPGTKEFNVVSQSGNNWMINHIFKRLLESEHEALETTNRERIALNTQNYDFTMLPEQSTGGDCPYVLAVQPKAPSKFVYRGRIWVNAKDFAVCRIEAEPALNPSFFIKQTEIHHAYVKVGDFWFPAENKSVSTLRLGGKATLTIEYRDYKILEARPLN